MVSSTESSERGRTKSLTRSIGAMSWAFLETMKTDYYWNISYVQVCLVARQHGQRSTETDLDADSAKCESAAPGALFADTAVELWVSVQSG